MKNYKPLIIPALIIILSAICIGKDWTKELVCIIAPVTLISYIVGYVISKIK